MRGRKTKLTFGRESFEFIILDANEIYIVCVKDLYLMIMWWLFFGKGKRRFFSIKKVEA
jgi:hypothetical protein